MTDKNKTKKWRSVEENNISRAMDREVVFCCE